MKIVTNISNLPKISSSTSSTNIDVAEEPEERGLLKYQYGFCTEDLHRIENHRQFKTIMWDGLSDLSTFIFTMMVYYKSITEIISSFKS